jgi:hypothetical protein
VGRKWIQMKLPDIDEQIKRLEKLQASSIYITDPTGAVALEEALATAYLAREIRLTRLRGINRSL